MLTIDPPRRPATPPPRPGPPPRPYRPTAGPGVVIVSPDVDASLAWAGRLHRAGPPRYLVRRWGDHRGYEHLRRAPGVLALLDVPHPESGAELVQRIRSLRLLAPVAVATAHRVDHAALLSAGAVNVLRRNSAESALAARIEADLRWLRRGPAPGPGRREPLRPYRSQSLLLGILLAVRSPLCCHDMRWLLGDAARPMSLRALRARVARLAPHLARHGLVCHRQVRWGADTLTVRPAAQGRA
ncbi:hypothetical protein ACSMX9_01200 [Streptomyces sp. LE64]|uniref:hypothetical protein n=1 Tax=Streptomyces sp. LE64 TaxID=3448653 RepID=UPI0040438989